MKKSRKRRFFSFLNLFILLAAFTLITACGGNSDDETGTDTGGNTTTDQSSVILTVSSNSVSYGTPITVYATVRNADGNLAANAVVKFSAEDSSFVAFTPTAATALTNSSGVAHITLNAASVDSAGATNLTAAATPSSSTVTSPVVGIEVNGAIITLGSITLGSSSISAYGTSSIKVPVYVNSVLATTTSIPVTFTSSCASASTPKATLSTPVNTVAGYAISTYTDSGCSQTDTITASVSSGAYKNADIIVAAPATNNIEFTSATPSTIGTSDASSSSLSTSSVVKFRVVDSSNNGVSGVLVGFSVVPESKPGGLALSAISATSDSSGYVTVSLSSGTVPTPVWVVATVDGTTLKSQSNTLTITTGLPTQNFFSLGAAKFNIEGWNFDGITTTLTIYASDRLGEPVPNGTAINFISEGAQVQTPCTTTDGACTTTFTSANDRPTDGRVTVLAYALGEKSFVDLDGDNAYDSTGTVETFYDIGDPYIDADEDYEWDATEQYIPSETSGSSACVAQSVATMDTDGKYYDALSKTNTCTGAWGQNYVRRSLVMILSGSKGYITDTDDSTTPQLDMANSCTRSFYLKLMDLHGNPMPADTTVTTADNDVYYTPHGSTQTAATVSITAGSPVPASSALGGTTIVLKVKATCDVTPDAYPTGTAYVITKTPKNVISTIPVSIVNTP